MSRSTRIRGALFCFVLAVTALVAVACGSRSGAGSPSATPQPDPLAQLAPCLSGTAARTGSTGGAHPVRFATFGTSPRAVILSNQSDEDLCPWLPFAKTLSSQGFRVVVYDYTVAPEYDTVTLTDYLRAHGVTTVSLMGASLGAKGSIIGATRLQPPPSALVTLSAEPHYGGYLIAKYAARVTVPVLFVSAAHDGYSAAPAARSFVRVAPAKVKKIDIVPGSAHGTALLSRPDVVTAVIAFLRAHDA